MKIHNEVRTNARRIVAMALALCLVFCTIPFAAGAEVVASGTWGDNVTWVLEDGVLTISGEGEMVYGTYPWKEYGEQITQVIVEPGVTIVPMHAFNGLPNLKKAIIGEGVTELEMHVFSGCENLTEVRLPSTLKTIGSDCFLWTGLQTIELPEGLEIIQAEAFCYTPLTEIVIPDTVTYIGVSSFGSCESLVYAKLSGGCKSMWNVFHDCVNLETVIIPEGIEELGSNMFENCSKLSNVVLPNSLTKLGLNCFENCSSLTNIVIPENVTCFGSGAFENCSSLATIRFDGNAPEFALGAFGYLTVTVYYPAGNETWTEAVMQQHGNLLTWVAYDAVGTCDNDLTWVLADGVLTISGEGAMEEESSASAYPWHEYRDQVIQVVVKSGVTSVPGSAFYYFTNLEKAIIEEGVESLGRHAFSNCKKLKEVQLPSTLKIIDADCFMWSGLETIDLPDGLEEVYDEAFLQTPLTEIVIPESVTFLGKDVFSGCANLKSAVLSSNCADIRMGAFRNCTALEQVTIPEGVVSIESSAFNGCTSLNNVILPSSVTSLHPNCFANCTSLTSMVIPAGVTTFYRPFVDCSGLKTLIFLGNAPVQEGNTDLSDDYAFQGVTANIYYPAGNDTWIGDVMQQYGGILTWTPYDTYGTWGEKITWSLAGGILTISGEGEMVYGTYPWKEYVEQITQVIVEPGVTSVPKHAFNGLPNLKKAIIGEGVTELGIQVFTGCENLIEVQLPSTLKTIDVGCFLLTGIQTIELPDGLETIGDEAFYFSALKEIVIPDTVTYIGVSSFASCQSLVYAKLSGGCKSMWNVFHDCVNLETVIIPEGIEELGSNMFEYCSKLSNVVLPNSLTKLGLSCFRNCSSLTNIVIPENVTRIESAAFGSCFALKTMRFVGNAPEFVQGALAFVTATVYYPAGNDTWNEAALQNHGGTITWIPVFPDVPEGEYYYEPVMWAVEKGITTGTGDGSTFSPERACTRAQVVTFLWRAAGSPEPQSMNHNFTDVEAGSYYEKAVIWAVENGITSGKGSSTTFQPETTCNRAEVVTFLWRAKGKPTPESNSNPFPDVPAGSYYEQAVLWAVENGITTGKGNGNFAPTESCTRAHVVTFLYRAFAEE